MATCSSILAWKITWTEEPGGLYIVHGIAESGMTKWLNTHTHTHTHTHTYIHTHTHTHTHLIGNKRDHAKQFLGIPS